MRLVQNVHETTSVAVFIRAIVFTFFFSFFAVPSDNNFYHWTTLCTHNDSKQYRTSTSGPITRVKYIVFYFFFFLYKHTTAVRRYNTILVRRIHEDKLHRYIRSRFYSLFPSRPFYGAAAARPGHMSTVRKHYILITTT